jgi:hypothetical protein
LPPVLTTTASLPKHVGAAVSLPTAIELSDAKAQANPFIVVTEALATLLLPFATAMALPLLVVVGVPTAAIAVPPSDAVATAVPAPLLKVSALPPSVASALARPLLSAVAVASLYTVAWAIAVLTMVVASAVASEKTSATAKAALKSVLAAVAEENSAAWALAWLESASVAVAVANPSAFEVAELSFDALEVALVSPPLPVAVALLGPAGPVVAVDMQLLLSMSVIVSLPLQDTLCAAADATKNPHQITIADATSISRNKLLRRILTPPAAVAGVHDTCERLVGCSGGRTRH